MSTKQARKNSSENGLRRISFEDPAPDSHIGCWSRDEHLRNVHGYVTDGDILEAETLDDMINNPEALSSQMETLEQRIKAEKAGDKTASTKKGAAIRLRFMKIILNWAVEMGNGDRDIYPDLTAGNGYNGMPACSYPQIGMYDER